MHFNHLNFPDAWRSEYSKYPQGLTILESLMQWIKQVDDMVDSHNLTQEQVASHYTNTINLINTYQTETRDDLGVFGNRLDAFILQFNGSLQNTVADTLAAWQLSGFLEIVISEALQTQITTVESKVNYLGISITSKGANGDWNGTTGTDNTAAIQAAFNDIGEGGTVFIPPGKFLTKAFTIPKKCRVIGYGTLVYDFDTATGPMMSILTDGTLIQDLAFDAKGTVGDFAYKSYIYSNKSNVHVNNCTFKNGMQGVHFDTWTSKHCKATNSHAENMKGSGFLSLGSGYVYFSGNTVISCGDGAISIFNGNNAKVTGNTVYYSDQGITIDAGSRSNVISGNTVVGNKAGTDSSTGYYGIDLKNNSHDNAISDNTISGCVVAIAARFGDRGVGLQALCGNNQITNNTITECNGKGFASNPGGILIEGQNGLIVTGNSISRTSGIAINAFAAGSYNRDLIIEGNYINLHGFNYGYLSYLNVNFTAIKVSGFSGVLIYGNTIRNAPEQMTAKNIVVIASTSVQIHENTFKSLTETAIELSGATTSTIKNNTFDSGNTSLNVLSLVDTVTEIIITGNVVEGQIGYFIIGNACPYYVENNKYYSTYSDALGGTGEKRIFNNDGLGGGKMRFNTGKIEVWNGSVWIVVGTQV